MQRLHRPHSGGSTHIRQYHVAKYQMDWPLGLLSQFDGPATSTGWQNAVSPRGETLAGHFPQRFFIFQYQNCFRAFRILAAQFQSVDRWQSQSRATAPWFRGEEWLKSAGSYLFAHFLPCVTYRKANVTSRSNVGIAGHIVRP